MNERTRGAAVKFEGVFKNFGQVTALHPTTLDVGAGEFLTLLGPSGSGKTSLLNIAAGYLLPDGGTLRLGGSDITSVPPRRRNIGMMFQNYALFPHMNVFDNVAYGLHVRRRPTQEVKQRVLAALEMVRLEGFEARGIQQLSGGQQQRVALARAIIIEPDLLLMDEPLGALDRQLRRHVQLEIRRLHEQSRRTTIYVTHDQEEALVMSDRIAVLNSGRLEQVGTPAELYRQPKNVFVATFLGESNLLRVTAVSRQATCIVFRLEGTEQTFKIPAYPDISQQDTAQLLVRPEDFRVESDGSGLAAEVLETVYLGELSAIRLRLQSGDLVWMRSMSSPHVKVGDRIRVSWEPGKARLLDQ